MTNKELTQEVEELIGYVEETHKYSMSRIYSLYNQVFETNETPQACASCLIRKVNALKTWLQSKQQPQEPVADQEEETSAEPTTPEPRKKRSRNKKSV